MMTQRIDDDQRRARLWARHHLGRTATDVRAAVRDLVAVHSSDPVTPHLAAWARTADYQTDALDTAIEAGALWRLHAMRRTLWVVDAREAAVFDGAAARAVAAKERKRVRGWLAAELDEPDHWLAETERQTLAAIAARPGVTTRTLTAELPALATRVTLGSGKWATKSAIGSRLLFQMAMEGKVARTAPAGSWKSSQYGWTVPDDGFGDRLDDEAARAALMRRYLARFGPVSLTDAKWWTGWTVAQTRKALARIEAVEVSTAGGSGWVLAGDVGIQEAPPVGVALLPGLDPTSMGYKERGWYLSADAEAALFDTNGNIGPTIWAEGRIVGGWAVRLDGRVVTRLLEPADEHAVAAEAERLTTWLAGVSVTPRFRTPLERELCGA